mmetsp:Transcript_98566/g.284383  ORF Transcript_98566/g.284383 Transcript_98566/m.284383 type:complete len:210 (-) Transcript_98566:1006-1635(-)
MGDDQRAEAFPLHSDGEGLRHHVLHAENLRVHLQRGDRAGSEYHRLVPLQHRSNRQRSVHATQQQCWVVDALRLGVWIGDDGEALRIGAEQGDEVSDLSDGGELVQVRHTQGVQQRSEPLVTELKRLGVHLDVLLELVEDAERALALRTVDLQVPAEEVHDPPHQRDEVLCPPDVTRDGLVDEVVGQDGALQPLGNVLVDLAGLLQALH